jgi:hypothetical protein
VQLSVDVVGEERNSMFGPIKVDRVLYVRQRQFDESRQVWEICSNAVESVAELCCGLCGGIGSLTPEIEAGSACPSCKKEGLAEVSSWIT